MNTDSPIPLPQWQFDALGEAERESGRYVVAEPLPEPESEAPVRYVNREARRAARRQYQKRVTAARIEGGRK